MAIKEENLIPYEGEIKAGQRLIKVGDSWMPVGVGGMFEPGSVQFIEVGGGVYYQCTSVDSDTTWSGKKWEMVDGIYVLAETVTSNLPYGTGFTPSVGTSYNADVTIRVDKMFEGASAFPEDGLVFYMPFDGSGEVKEGEVTSQEGSLTYGEVSGIGYATFNKVAIGAKTSVEIPTGADCTLAAIFRANDNIDTNERYVVSINSTDFIKAIRNGDSIRYTVNNQNFERNRSIYTGKFVYAAVVWKNQQCTVRFDGETLTIDSATQEAWTSFLISAWYGNAAQGRYLGDIADVAIWNRALTDEEITLLASRAASMNG